MAQLDEVTYDEDITKNKLFLKLNLSNKIMLETAAMEKWIICLPRNESLESVDFCQTDFVLSHILVPSEDLPGCFFTTLIGENFELCDKLLTSRTNKEQRQVLFEETFYFEAYSKIRFWCISSPLTTTCKYTFEIQSIATPEQASDLLVSETGSSAVLKVINMKCVELRGVFEAEDTDLEALVVGVQRAIEECTTLLLSRKGLRKQIGSDTLKLHIFKIAITLLVFTNLDETMFEIISTTSSRKSENLNRSLRAAHTTSAEEFQIPSKYLSLLSAVKEQFSLIGSYKNPLGKLLCLKNAVKVLQMEDGLPIVDDLIPIFVYSIIKSEYPHWMQTSIYLRHFLHFFEGKYRHTYEHYLLTTLEAAVYFIMTGSHQSPGKPYQISTKVEYESKTEYLKNLFELIATNDEIGALKLLNINVPSDKEIFNLIADKRLSFAPPINVSSSLCHPLCDCEECREKVVKSYPDLNSSDDRGRTCLHIAASCGFSRMASILISLGCNVNACDHNGYTPLHCAANKGHQNILLLLLNSSADMNSINASGETPLHLAVMNGHSGCVKGLLFFADHIKVKLDIDKKNTLGNTALCIASKWGYYDIVESLLEYGADTNISDNNNNRPAKLTCNVKIRNLIEKLPNKTIQNAYAKTAGIDAEETSQEQIFSAIKNNDITLACFHLGIDTAHGEKNIEIQHYINCLRNKQGHSLLHFAAIHNRAEMIEKLLENGANTDIRNKSGLTAIHSACKFNKIEAVSSLLQFSVSSLVDLQDNEGNTAVHHCVLSGASEILKLLLQYYPDLEIRNNNNLRALDLARKNSSLNIVTILEQQHCN